MVVLIFAQAERACCEGVVRREGCGIWEGAIIVAIIVVAIVVVVVVGIVVVVVVVVDVVVDGNDDDRTGA